MLEITKEKSTRIKGVVILMMIFLHLFNGSHTDLCSNLLYVRGVPFCKWITGAFNPVNFFMLLSGYGLTVTYYSKGLFFAQQVKRVLKIYIHWWIVLILFLTIGWLMFPGKYPGSLCNIILNAIGWRYSYNGEMWFLFPYVFLSLLSPLIIPVVERLGYKWSLIVAVIIQLGTCLIISRYGSSLLYGNLWLYNPFLVVHLLSPFLIGVCLYLVPVKLNGVLPQWLAYCLMAALVVLMASWGNSGAYILYVPAIIFLMCQVSLPKRSSAILTELGRKSMPMWMIHTWLCYYLFQPQVYSLRYPILIWIAMVIVSYLIALFVTWGASKVISAIRL